MKNNYQSWKLMGKALVALAGLALLWQVYPVLAGILSVVASLCMIAFLGDNSKPLAANGELTLEEFRRQLGFTEAVNLVELPGAKEERQEDREFVAAD